MELFDTIIQMPKDLQAATEARKHGTWSPARHANATDYQDFLRVFSNIATYWEHTYSKFENYVCHHGFAAVAGTAEHSIWSSRQLQTLRSGSGLIKAEVDDQIPPLQDLIDWMLDHDQQHAAAMDPTTESSQASPKVK